MTNKDYVMLNIMYNYYKI